MFIGLYFGSFNPVHNGHLSIASQMLQKVGFDEVWFVISPQNPLKDTSDLISDTHRLMMTNLAVNSTNLPFRVCDIELSMPTPSFTINTLSEIKQRFPEHTFAIIMGGDNAALIERWRDFQKILSSYSVYYYPREGDGSNQMAVKHCLHKVEASLLNYSSTTIRQLLSEGNPVDNLVPKSVLRYIKEHNLYR